MFKENIFEKIFECMLSPLTGQWARGVVLWKRTSSIKRWVSTETCMWGWWDPFKLSETFDNMHAIHWWGSNLRCFLLHVPIKIFILRHHAVLKVVKFLQPFKNIIKFTLSFLRSVRADRKDLDLFDIRGSHLKWTIFPHRVGWFCL